MRGRRLPRVPGWLAYSTKGHCHDGGDLFRLLSRHLARLLGPNLNEPTQVTGRFYRMIKLGLSINYDNDQQEKLALCTDRATEM